MVGMMPRDKFSPAGKWGESKQRINVMLTPTAVDRLDKVAEELGITRSEALERLCRTECLGADRLNDSADGGDNAS